MKHVVQRLELESTALRLADDADAHATQLGVDCFHRADEPRRLPHPLLGGDKVCRRRTDDAQFDAGRRQDWIRSAKELQEVRPLDVPLQVCEDHSDPFHRVSGRRATRPNVARFEHQHALSPVGLEPLGIG